MSEEQQLAALAELDRTFRAERIDYWLFGGSAVDFHAGAVTRDHADLDLAVWLSDHARTAALLTAACWTQGAAHTDEGSVAFGHGGVRLELAFLARDDPSVVYTPVGEGREAWAAGAFERDRRELGGIHANVISLGSLRAKKSQHRDDAAAARKDRVDRRTLERLM